MNAGLRAWAEIDLGAFDHNMRVVRSAVAPAAVWAVVKADGYGHGAVTVAHRAMSAGADGVCVALTAEGIALREAGIDAPILVLSEQPQADAPTIVRSRLTPTVYTTSYADALARAVEAEGAGTVPVHVKLDTGMQRVGVAPGDAIALMRHLGGLAPALGVEGVFTHLACADEPAAESNRLQLGAFDASLDELAGVGYRPPLVHAANSAAALAIPASRRSLVRAGIALYGISPGSGVTDLAGALRPVLALKARVAYVKRVAAGTHVSYGWRHRFEHDTTLVTVPLGYADGVSRRLGTLPDRPGADVLIGGHRCPIVGVVTMDQLMVDIGGVDHHVAVGDEVVLIGRQGSAEIRVEEWADRLGTIGYEVVCGVSARVPRLPGNGQADV